MAKQELKEFIEPRLKYLRKYQHLYSPLFGEVTFQRIEDLGDEQHIVVRSELGEHFFNLNGELLYDKDRWFYSDRCLLFPSHKSNPSWKNYFVPGMLLVMPYMFPKDKIYFYYNGKNEKCNYIIFISDFPRNNPHIKFNDYLGDGNTDTFGAWVANEDDMMNLNTMLYNEGYQLSVIR